MVLTEIIVLGIAIIVAILVFKFFEDLIRLAIHAVIGLIILFIANALGFNVAISIWTILICAFGGVIGAIMVIILSYLKIAFVG
ncbi:MAG: pro-sigmaK processing inhibitor BofA family protein [Clostridiales bacterium]